MQKSCQYWKMGVFFRSAQGGGWRLRPILQYISFSGIFQITHFFTFFSKSILLCLFLEPFFNVNRYLPIILMGKRKGGVRWWLGGYIYYNTQFLKSQYLNINHYHIRKLEWRLKGIHMLLLLLSYLITPFLLF